MSTLYTPHGAAAQLFRSSEAEVVLCGGAGTGKSLACLWKIVSIAVKYKKARLLIVRKSRESLTTTGLVTLQEHVLPDLEKNGVVEYYGGSKREAAQYRFVNKSKIMIGGMDKSTKIMSSEYDIIYVQEAIELTLDDWEKLTSRLRNGRVPYQQIIADTNPDSATHWLKQRADDGKAILLESRHEDNPTLYNRATKSWTRRGAKYLHQLDSLTGVNYQRLRLGRWVAAEGIIYDDFNPLIHVIDRFEIPDDWTRYWTVDFGYTNPFVCQWWAEDPDGRLYLYREIYRSEIIVEEHAKTIMEIIRPDGQWVEPKPSAVIADHDAEDRVTFTKHTGITTKAANKKVLIGIEAVKSRMRTAGDGKPRIFILRDSLVYKDQTLRDKNRPCSTIEEIPQYVWSKNKTDKGQDQPEKRHDHGVDCIRYMVAHLDIRNKPKIGVVYH